jgi:hypothetical protein
VGFSNHARVKDEYYKLDNFPKDHEFCYRCGEIYNKNNLINMHDAVYEMVKESVMYDEDILSVSMYLQNALKDIDENWSGEYFFGACFEEYKDNFSY